MKDLAIFGAGGFGRETAWLIQEVNQVRDSWNLLGFFDDGRKLGTLVDGLPVLGGISELNEYPGHLDVVIAIADPAVRQSLVSKITNKRVGYPSVIHPTALIGAPGNVIGRGCIITAGVILTTGIGIGDFSILNLSTTIGHDVVLEPYTSIMPQCSISGNVRIGTGCFVGAGARILQGVSLGEGCVVGAGAVVTKNFPARARVVGVPARDNTAGA